MGDELGPAGEHAEEVSRGVAASMPASTCKRFGTGLIEIDIGRGVWVYADVDAEALARVLSVLDRR
jgi:hypothetical protein